MEEAQTIPRGPLATPDVEADEITSGITSWEIS